MRHDFANAAASNGDFIDDFSAKLANADVPDVLSLPKYGMEAAEEIAKPSILRAAFDAAASTPEVAAKFGGKAVKVVPVAGTLIGLGMNHAEAGGLEQKMYDAVERGDMPIGAVQDYAAILAGHTATGADAGIFLGEGAVRHEFENWATKYGIVTPPPAKSCARPHWQSCLPTAHKTPPKSRPLARKKQAKARSSLRITQCAALIPRLIGQTAIWRRGRKSTPVCRHWTSEKPNDASFSLNWIPPALE
ncbi:MAG: hypothetical protein ABW189_00710 [Rickettsiales bacterium]